MASGSFNLTRTGSTSSYVNFLVNWSSYSNGSVANSSTLNVAVYVTKSSGSTSNTWGTVNTSVSVTDAGTQNENGISLNVAPNGSQLVFARNFTVPHNSDGKKSATISVNVGGDVVWGNGSANINLDTIPRQATLLTAPNFNDEENPQITFKNPGNFTIDAYIEASGMETIIHKNIPNTGSYIFEFTEEERQRLYSVASSNSLNVTFGLQTTIGSTKYWSFISKTMTIINANHIFNNFAWETTNYQELTGDNLTVIKGYSNVKTIISEENKATALKEATLTSYQTTIGSKSVTNNNIAYPVENVIRKVDGASITVFANDSRGNSTPIIKPISNYIEYKKIIGSISNLERTQQVNSEVNLQVEGEIDLVNFGAIVNSVVSVKYYYKEASSNDDFVEGTTKLNATLTQIEGTKYKYEIDQNIAGDLGANGFDINKSFLIRIVINDELDFAEDTETLGNGSPAIAVKGNCVSLGSPYNETLGGRVQINGEVYEGNKQFYSTQEQLIGSWIDGKPLYRKVTELEPKFIQGDNIYNTNITNFKTLVTSRLYFKYNNNWYENWDNVYNKIYRNSGSEYVVNCSGTLTLQQMYLITEYTKTTD